MPAVTKLWHLVPHDRAAIERLASELQTSPVVAQLLLNRGVKSAVDGRRFLDSPLTGLHSPQSLPGVPEAVELLYRAVEEKKKICVYGDYDVDGVTGTAILLGLFQQLGAPAEFYVPHRLEEGYGLNVEALRQLAASGVQVVVTVDCGIASLAEADEAKAPRHRADRHRPPRDEGPPAGRGRLRPPAAAGDQLPVRRAVRGGGRVQAGVGPGRPPVRQREGHGPPPQLPPRRPLPGDPRARRRRGPAARREPHPRPARAEPAARRSRRSASRPSSNRRRSPRTGRSGRRTSASSSPRGSTRPAGSGVPGSWSRC